MAGVEMKCEICGISEEKAMKYMAYGSYICGSSYTNKKTCLWCFLKMQKQDKDFQEWA
jgi:hypothetical protein